MCSFFRPESSSSASVDQPELKALRSRLEVLEADLTECRKRLTSCSEQNAALTDENDRIKKDHEDLLFLLADQDAQVLKYKDRLKDLGQTVRFFKKIVLSIPDLN